MTRFKRSEVLWIVRGMRLGKCLLYCTRTLGRHFNAIVRPDEADVADGPNERPPVRRMPPLDTRRKQMEGLAACEERRPRKQIPSTGIPRADASTDSTPLGH